MCQYFNFVNKSTGVTSTVPIPNNFGLAWANSMSYMSKNEITHLFLYVIRANSWKLTDTVIAEGDSGDSYDSSMYLTDLTETQKNMTAKELCHYLVTNED